MRQMIYRMAMALWLIGSVTWAEAAQMTIQVETAQIRETPAVFGKIVTTARYGDRVEVLVRQGAWTQVRTAEGLSGWMPESALTKKKLELTAGSKDVSRTASGEELAMAGKGFNSQVEADFKAKNQTIDFSWIDRMETFGKSDDQILAFLKEGGLQP